MTTLVAFDTAPQESVLDCPVLIVLGLAVKDGMTGGPGQTGGAVAVEVAVGMRVGVLVVVEVGVRVSG
jgi:hypothetical protein